MSGERGAGVPCPRGIHNIDDRCYCRQRAPTVAATPEPYYTDGQITLYNADCLTLIDSIECTLIEANGTVDAIVTDPPYGDTALSWDRTPDPGWINAARCITSQVWCFGSMRFFLSQSRHFNDWFTYGQDVVWEKHNGSGFSTDRFKRVHEHAIHWYRGPWGDLQHDVPKFAGERKSGFRRRQPTHTGQINDAAYDSIERLERSVIYVRSEHGRAGHPTQKPLGILRPLIQYSVPVGGIVLDPFSGSGSTLVAARDMGRRAIGIEAREEYCAATVARLNQSTLSLGDAA